MSMFPAATYQARRAALLARLRDAGACGLVLLPGHVDSPMNYRDNAYEFRQDSSFLYFCGLQQPELALLLDIDDGSTTLHGDDIGIDHLVWTGPLPSVAERAALSGIERTATNARLGATLSTARTAGRDVHFLKPYRGETRLALAAWLGLADAQIDAAASRALTLAAIALRAVKSTSEVAEIENALHVTRDMHHLAMRLSRPGVVEQEIVGAMEGLALAHGRRLAYPSIFTSRGEILHNHDHSVKLKGGELIVNDTGANSPIGYASDITRTIPVGGRFTGLQAELYDLVLDAQTQAIAAVAPGVPYRDIHGLACRVMVEGMKTLGFMRGDAAEAVQAGAHAIFFQCGTGHMMGLDVHDMEGLGENDVGYGEGFTRSTLFGHKSLRLARPLQPGFVVTIEPGVYINRWLTERWQAEGRHAQFIDYAMFDRHADFGGIRIEDDILVTADGRRELGPPIARTRIDVEAQCAS
ncbi:aminopeptidase P family protein [Scleromatobacter humisilvae]|uniref:Xaa-Pro aminopeptidase n=1 Tax=Scleromatobacter humisilvae TaxID=2897159 RepID=A0A9X2C2H6_9BURK|nr:aminopeptidase P family protein [Scleromatobacter humisilvae]MCK9686015.1 aminopeptidase P family protein [Scleromatobacter humisilvae]